MRATWIADDRAEGAGLRQPRRRDAGGEARRAARRRSTPRASRRRSRARRPPERAAQAAALLKAAKNIRDADRARVAQRRGAGTRASRLPRRLGARVITDLKVGASFPTDHPLHRRRAVGADAGCRRPRGARQGRRDPQPRLGRSRRHAEGRARRRPRTPRSSASRSTISIHNGWSMDHQGLAPVDLLLAADPEHAVPLLLDALGAPPKRGQRAPGADRGQLTDRARSRSSISPARCATPSAHAMSRSPHLPLSWNGAWWPFRHPLDFLGSDGGGGLGGRPGVAVGAALALKGSRPHRRSASAATAIS